MIRMLCVALLLLSSSAIAMDLPKMSYSNQKGFLKSFPLDKATAIDVLNSYGPPKSKMDLTETVSVWTYYKYDADGVSYSIQFQDGKVHDIVNRYHGFTGPTERKARKIQGLND